MKYEYESMLGHILDTGVERTDRTGTGTFSVFGGQMRFDLREHFPLVTTKKVFWKGVVHELLWLLSGSTHVGPLNYHGVHIWDKWADENGDLGPVYGAQWRRWPDPDGGSFDQIRMLVDGIKADPYSRRHIVSAWNVAQLPEMALVPCHTFVQFYVANGELSCHLYQRSADMFLGVPFNIASYALLTHMIAAQTNLAVGDFVHSFGDAHIYLNHVDQVREQLRRTIPPFPRFVLPHADDIFSYDADEVIDGLVGYHPHPAIHGEVAV